MAVAESMAGDPSASIPRQGKQWKRTKGAYRLFDHADVTLASISAAHWENTRQACDGCAVTLLIQDTTWLDYRDHPCTAGLGWFGRGREAGGRGEGSGVFLHSVLAVEPGDGSGGGEGGGRVLGLAHAALWTRTGEPVGATGPRRHRRRMSDDRESLRWVSAVQQVGDAAAASRRLHVGDRESDLFDLYRAAQSQVNVGFVTRVKHDRNAIAGHDEGDRRRPVHTSLKDVCRAMPVLGGKRLWIKPRAGRSGRWAKLNVSGGPVTVWPPQLRGRNRQAEQQVLRCWALRVWEIDPPAGHKPIEWMILTSEPINDLSDALRLTAYYTLRWLVEEYHQCLKSGCRVQERQLESVDRLAPLIGMLSVVAVRLLQLKNDVRLMPQRPATDAAPAPLVNTLAKLIGVAPATLTARRFVHEVAKLGGFVGRRRDGEPGWKTLWHGWHELTLIHAGHELAQMNPRCG